jgi:hypothetical protein
MQQEIKCLDDGIEIEYKLTLASTYIGDKDEIINKEKVIEFHELYEFDFEIVEYPMSQTYVMVQFAIYDGEREYQAMYYYTQETYEQMTALEILRDFFGDNVSSNTGYKINSYWDSERVVQLEKTYTFTADKNKLKEYNSIGIWGNNG